MYNKIINQNTGFTFNFFYFLSYSLKKILLKFNDLFESCVMVLSKLLMAAEKSRLREETVNCIGQYSKTIETGKNLDYN